MKCRRDLIILFFFIILSFPALARNELPFIERFSFSNYPQGEELQMMEELIQMTELSLASQKELAQEIKSFNAFQKMFMANKTDRKLAYQFLQQANFLAELIEESHLKHLFRKEFLEELTALSETVSEDKVAG